MVTRTNRLTVALVFGLLGAGVNASEKPESKPADKASMPQWDGIESSADYAKRVGLEPTLTLDLGGGIKLETVLIPAGQFIMGTPEPEPVDEGKFQSKQALEKAKSEYQAALARFKECGVDEKPAHKVTLSKPFYIGKYTVTQEQFQQVMVSNPSHFKGKDNPVETDSYKDAQEFCKRLSDTLNLAVRLPTEAEWEYSCRAGTNTKYYSGDKEDDLQRVAWCSNNSNRTTHPVGQKEPNKFNLYDMHGNVWQWCQDGFGDYKAGAVADPQSPAKDNSHVARGGSWQLGPVGCRSARRAFGYPGNCEFFGFRVVVVPASKTP